MKALLPNSSINLNKSQAIGLTVKQPKDGFIRELSQLRAHALRLGLFSVYVTLNNRLWHYIAERAGRRGRG